MKICLLMILNFIISISSHSVKFPKSNEVKCSPPQSKNDFFLTKTEEFQFPVPISWHVHITFMPHNKDEVALAIKIRNKAKEHFKDHLGPDCENRYENKYFCAIYDHDILEPFGPFPIGEISFWIPNHYLTMTMTWFAQNREGLSIVFHPNTGCEYEDHSIWAIWIGDSWKLDMSIFDKNTQTNEFDNHAGDELNPTCVENNRNCGSTDYDGPGLPCCSGSYCNCSEARKCLCTPLHIFNLDNN